ncbi:MAG TPA: metal-binding protein, partial [Herpetosiphonaceae bacterium]
MPGAKTHDMLTVVTGVAGMPVAWALLPDHNLAAVVTLAGAHLVSGLAFSPDLDLASELYRRWGPLRVIWYPYREAISHRSWISHSLVIGPLLRLAYFLAVSGLLIFAALHLINLARPVDIAGLIADFRASARDLRDNHFSMIIYFLIGFVTGSAVHSIADWMFEGDDPFHNAVPIPRWFKRLWRKGWAFQREVQREAIQGVKLHIVKPSARLVRQQLRKHARPA